MSFNNQQIQNYLKSCTTSDIYLMTRRTCSTANRANVGADAAVHFFTDTNNTITG